MRKRWASGSQRVGNGKERGDADIQMLLFGDIVNGMRSRWQREADAAIKEFGLVVYGDHWAG